MIENVILHVGLPKTATTFLQENVWPGLAGYTYLSRPYTQHNYAFNQLQFADDSLYNKQLVIEELKKIAPNKLLISDETLSGKPIFLSCLNRTMIATRLKNLFPDATIILFIRDQMDIMVSQYHTYIKMPYGVKKIQDFFWQPERNYSYSDYLSKPSLNDMNTLFYNTNDYFIHCDCFRYSHLVNCYTQLFDKVKVYLYEDFKIDTSSTIESLEKISGEKISVLSESRKNTSFSKRRLEARRNANKYTNNPYFRSVLELGFQVTPWSTPDLHKIVSDSFDSHYAKDNALLKALLPSLPWHKYPDKYKS